MVRSDKDVIAGTYIAIKSQLTIDWNKQINVTAEELDKWLKSPKSKKAGWSKEDGSGESVGHKSYIYNNNEVIVVVARSWKY